MLYVVASTFLL